MTLLGELSLWVALLMAAWTVLASYAGGMLRRSELVASGERAVYAMFLFTALAAAGIAGALLTRDYSLRFVASHTSNNLPTIYALAAFWSVSSGALLFWALLLTAVSAIAVVANRRANRELMPWVTGTLGTVLLLFLIIICFEANPYVRLDFVPIDGRGLEPELQHAGMLMHPPLRYLGLAASVVPFAFAVAAVVTRQLGVSWVKSVRRWTLVSWFLLTVSIVLGMWWAYREIDRTGSWMWDAVSNATVLPWLTATALLHGTHLQETRGVMRRWNVVLVVITFLLSIVGARVAFNGVTSTAQAIWASPDRVWLTVLFVGMAAVMSLLIRTRLADVRGAPEDTPPRTRRVSREAVLIAGNMTLVGVAALALYAALAGVGVEGVSTLTRAMPQPRYGAALVAALLALFVIAFSVRELVAGVIAHRRMDGGGVLSAAWHVLTHDRRRYGGYLAHTGISVVLCALVGFTFSKQVLTTLKTGEALTATDAFGRSWTFRSQGISSYPELNRHVIAVSMSASRDGRPMGLLTAEQRQYVDETGEPTSPPASAVSILQLPLQDVFVLLLDAADNDTAAVRIVFNPLVGWVWLGGLLVAVGGLVVMWPRAA